MIRLAVVEDDQLYAKQLQDYLEQYQQKTGQCIKAQFFSDGEDIVDKYKADYDIILMDIQMPFIDGMTAAKIIREQDENVIIMFITNMMDYAIKGYEVDAMDYILKPLSYYTFSQKLGRAIKRLAKGDGYFLLVPVADGVRRVAAANIYYIESQSHIMIYHTTSGVLEAKGRLDDLEKELSNYGFFRSNKSYLVNMHHVEGIQDGCCLVGGERLLISRRQKAAFMQRLAKIL